MGREPLMSEKQYLSERLDDQINWFDKKSAFNQKWYKRLQVMIIVASCSIPFLTGFVDENGFYVKFTIAVLGLVIASFTAVLGLYQFQDNWMGYRMSCESLIQEKHLFLTGAGPYSGDEPFPLLVERVEALIASDISNWSANMKKAHENGVPST